MARLWIEKGRLWEYYRENNPKISRKIMDEYFRKQEIREIIHSRISCFLGYNLEIQYAAEAIPQPQPT